MSEVEETWKRKRASQEEDNTLRSVPMEPKESLQGYFVVVCQDVDFTLKKNKGSNTREQNWKAIESLNSQRSCRVSSLMSGHAR